PAGVVDVVAVEMDGAVMGGLTLPVMLLAGPVPALHAAGRQMEEPAVMAGGADIDGPGAADILREIPAGDDRARLAPDKSLMTRRGCDAREQHRPVDLAVEMATDAAIRLRASGEDQRGRRRRGGDGESTAVLPLVVDIGIGAKRALLQPDPARSGIDRDRN